MIVIRGRKMVEMDGAELAELAASFRSVALDIGAGDGLWTYRYARSHPDGLAIALDPVAENLREVSAKATRKPERGGAANALYVLGAIERPPAELQGVADEISITLPWGSLMRGIVLGETGVLGGIASFGKQGATVRIVLNTRIFDDPVPVDARGLPEVTPEYVQAMLTDPFRRAGMRITLTREMDADEVAALETTWAKRLSHRQPPRSVLIEARKEADRA